MRPFIFFICLSFQLGFAQQELKHQVYFETDKYNIPETEHSRLLLFLSSLKNRAIKKITIYGFCDDRGSNNYNLVLSQQRANAIKTLFHNHKFNDTLITNVDGKGKILLNIVQEDDITKIRGLNRKVEITVKFDFLKKSKKTNTLHSVETILNGSLKKGDKILLNNLLFRTGYSYLIPESKKSLDKIAEILVKRKDIYFTVEGHVCCTNGTRDAIDRKTKRRNLSVARAKYIYDFLAKKGVSKHRMTFVGHKRKFPLGGKPELDKRVEILVTQIKNP